MTADNMQKLIIEDTVFDDARSNFNRVLQKLFHNMIDSGSSEGSITLKMDVSLVQEYVPNFDPDVDGESRKIQKPTFKHKVASAVAVKDDLSGNKNPEMELIWDDELKMYVLAHISNTDQRTIFDKDQPWNNCEETQEETEPSVPMLPGTVADERALPGEVQEEESDVIDGNYREEGEDEEDSYGYEEPQEPEE